MSDQFWSLLNLKNRLCVGPVCQRLSSHAPCPDWPSGAASTHRRMHMHKIAAPTATVRSPDRLCPNAAAALRSGPKLMCLRRLRRSATALSGRAPVRSRRDHHRLAAPHHCAGAPVPSLRAGRQSRASPSRREPRQSHLLDAAQAPHSTP
jgi:hypothetical protein